MSYSCENCKEDGFSNIVSTVFKVVVLGVLIYVAFTYKDMIKQAVAQAAGKLKG
ncbi:MAG: hypothetical protein IM574_10825 [Cytophagales bacterium]|jgi:hypothetical protein|nr:hypothetical protein [Cytophagales bacterium]MCA6387527.1 hypothetical protein [Cytophagales bacterium]MCA6391198.1 hypothetical protein [Cytophagales bacterium]MCA6395836.1 hypothetical protein [Cytophagales bacterium]MCA6397657.1 hypothetical protein [Cytophagales bacterium]